MILAHSSPTKSPEINCLSASGRWASTVHRQAYWRSDEPLVCAPPGMGPGQAAQFNYSGAACEPGSYEQTDVSRRFAETTGNSPLDWITSLRVGRARSTRDISTFRRRSRTPVDLDLPPHCAITFAHGSNSPQIVIARFRRSTIEH